MTVLERINQEYARMTKAEKALAAYLMSHTEEFGQASVQELAARNSVSTTTIIRFCRRLGYDGFREFKQALALLERPPATLPGKFEKIAAQSGDRLLADTVKQAFTCLEETFASLPDEKVRQTVRMIHEARRVYCFGMKESFALAHYAYTRFYTVRNDTVLLEVTNGDVEPLLDLCPKDVCLYFLFHRYTRQSLDLLAAVKKTGARVILFTNPPLDEVEALADILLPCAVCGNGVKNTAIAPVCLLDYLCNALALDHSEQTLERFEELERLFRNQEVLGQ